MESALIVSCTEKSTAFFLEMLNAMPCAHIVTVKSCGEARRRVLERDFDLVLINSPLRDETGESLACDIAGKGSGQVILVVKSEYYEAVCAATEEAGILTVAKPLNRAIFWSTLKLAKSAQYRLRRAKAENNLLKQKIEDIRVINRAKCLLVSYLNMSEQQAHRYIEKQAMDMRTTKRAIAEGLIKTYDS